MWHVSVLNYPIAHLISCMKNNTIALIIDKEWPHIIECFNTHQIRHLSAVKRCRTPQMGGHLYVCNRCQKEHLRYNSCRNRHCPQCQNTQKQRWVEKRKEQLLDVPYFHVVFTMPHILNGLCLGYQNEIYSLLFEASWQTLNQFGWSHKNLGAQLGATMVLHTWGSNMSYHPHIHCIVPGGGISIQSKWKNTKQGGKFLFPVKALSTVYRAIFMKKLLFLLDKWGMDNASDLIKKCYKNNWVVYAKQPFGGKDGVINYLARYTHKIAITNHRILKYDNNYVTFRYTDYRCKNQQKTMTLSTKEFVRRFAMHILPHGFRRIRHFGILSSAYKKILFPESLKTPIEIEWENIWLNKGLDVQKCNYCKKGNLVLVQKIKPIRGPPKHTNNINITLI